MEAGNQRKHLESTFAVNCSFPALYEIISILTTKAVSCYVHIKCARINQVNFTAENVWRFRRMRQNCP